MPSPVAVAATSAGRTTAVAPRGSVTARRNALVTASVTLSASLTSAAYLVTVASKAVPSNDWWVQYYTVRRQSGPDAVDVDAQGPEVLAGDTDVVLANEAGLRAWAGRAADPFWIEPDVLHAVGHALEDGTTVQLGDWQPANATNLFAGQTVYSLVLEVPDADLTPRAGEGRIGVWAVATLGTDAGGWRPINRVGLPMIHPLFTQFDEQLGDDLNAGSPRDDYATYGERLAGKLAAVIGAYGTAADPQAQGRVVARRLFPNVLPYAVGTPAAFSFVGFNGRSLIDNAPDVMFSLAANTPIALGIGQESVKASPRDEFPYVPPFG